MSKKDKPYKYVNLTDSWVGTAIAIFWMLGDFFSKRSVLSVLGAGTMLGITRLAGLVTTREMLIGAICLIAAPVTLFIWDFFSPEY